MRTSIAVSVALVVVLAGCTQAPGTATTTATTSAAETTDVAETATGGTGAGTNAAPSDPESDVLGWENGVWYNETLSINQSDGLNGTELSLVVNRSMARVEHLRELEFERTVPVKIVTRSEYRNQYARTGDRSEAFRTFDNVKFEALFLVGEESDSLSVQQSNRGSNVLGFYSPRDDRIVVVSESETPRLTETTLGHELVHALQDQHFNTSFGATTRELHNAHNGVVEGDARYVDRLYGDRCDGDWNCTTQPGGPGGGGGDLHLGIYLLKYFPYSDGPGLVGYMKKQGGWAAVNALYENPPASTDQVANPEEYGEDAPAEVDLPDRSSDAWRRVTPEGNRRAPYASLGQSSLLAMFAYPAYDQSSQGFVVSPRTFLNVNSDGEVNTSDPINYTIPVVEGWNGDKMWIYENGDEAAYVWRLAWDSPAEASEFAAGYRDLLAYWGGEPVNGTDGVWRIPEGESGFADAFYVHVEGDTVTIVNAPTTDQLSEVWADAPEG